MEGSKHMWHLGKKGDKSLPENYRPVSHTSVTCKILEHIIHSHVMDHLERFDILVDAQHSFRAKRSTETQLILTVDDIARTLELGSSIHMAILDFSKAFDKVPHGRLLTKLAHYGIQGNFIHGLETSLLTGLRELPVKGTCHHHREYYRECLRGQFWALCYFSFTLMICRSSWRVKLVFLRTTA